MRLALLQLSSRGLDQAAAWSAGEAACRQAAAAGADLALLPEMWSAGYAIPRPDDTAGVASWQALAGGPDEGFCARFGRLAAELGLAVGVGYLERWPGRPRNSLALFDRRGGLVLNYAKVHTCAFDREILLTPGDGFPVAELDLGANRVRVGAMICFDREFPESARCLVLAGAELILVPNACDLERNRLAQFHARAYENMCALAMCNYAAPTCNGQSLLLDGMAFAADESSRDMTVAQAGEDEEVLLADLDLAALRAYRAREPWGGAYRRPELYGVLTAAKTLQE